MSAKHTPGPWTYDPETNRDWTIRSQAFGRSDMMGDYRGLIVADLLPAHGERGHAMAEANANARLIAAAPELLAKLKEVLACDDDHTDLFYDDPEFRRELEAVVAKAEGRE